MLFLVQVNPFKTSLKFPMSHYTCLGISEFPTKRLTPAISGYNNLFSYPNPQPFIVQFQLQLIRVCVCVCVRVQIEEEAFNLTS